MTSLYVALDLETTGLDADKHAIIEIGAVKFRGEQVVDQLESLVDPGQHNPIPHNIQQLTGITPAMLKGKPPLPAILPRLEHFVGDASHSPELYS